MAINMNMGNRGPGGSIWVGRTYLNVGMGWRNLGPRIRYAVSAGLDRLEKLVCGPRPLITAARPLITAAVAVSIKSGLQTPKVNTENPNAVVPSVLCFMPVVDAGDTKRSAGDTKIPVETLVNLIMSEVPVDEEQIRQGFSRLAQENMQALVAQLNDAGIQKLLAAVITMPDPLADLLTYGMSAKLLQAISALAIKNRASVIEMLQKVKPDVHDKVEILASLRRIPIARGAFDKAWGLLEELGWVQGMPGKGDV